MRARHILIVDDEPDVRLMVRTYLQWKGDYEVLEAKCGEEAVRLASQQPIDLVLMDVRMPGMGGIEACRLLKAMDKTRNVPIVFVSAWTAEADLAAARHAGGDGFLSKPFSFRDLSQMINQRV